MVARTTHRSSHQQGLPRGPEPWGAAIGSKLAPRFKGLTAPLSAAWSRSRICGIGGRFEPRTRPAQVSLHGHLAASAAVSSPLRRASPPTTSDASSSDTMTTITRPCGTSDPWRRRNRHEKAPRGNPHGFQGYTLRLLHRAAGVSGGRGQPLCRPKRRGWTESDVRTLKAAAKKKTRAASIARTLNELRALPGRRHLVSDYLLIHELETRSV